MAVLIIVMLHAATPASAWLWPMFGFSGLGLGFNGASIGGYGCQECSAGLVKPGFAYGDRAQHSSIRFAFPPFVSPFFSPGLNGGIIG
jgi:hypothetical protein